MTKWSYAAGSLMAATLMACAVQKKPPATPGGKSLAEAYVQAWNQHDSVAIDTLLASDAIHEDLAQNFRGKGAAEVVKFMRQAMSAEPDYKWQATNFVEEGRFVAFEWNWTSTYTGPDPTGKQVKNKKLSGRGESYAEVGDGKIKRFTDYYDLASFFH